MAVFKRSHIKALLGDRWTIAVVVLLGLPAIASLGARTHWFADLLANLRVQQMLGLLFAAAICVFVKRWRPLVAVGLIGCVHLPFFWAAYCSIEPDPVEHGRAEHIQNSTGDQQLTVTIVNALSSNHRHELIIADIHRRAPDVFAVLELTTKLAENLKESFLADYPHVIQRPNDHDNFGIAVYSKHEIESPTVFTLNTSIESIGITIRPFESESVRFLATHPLPPMGAGLFLQRNEHLKQLGVRIAKYQDNNPETPTILVGDLNLTPWSPLFADLLGSARLKRAAKGTGMKPTWHAGPTAAMGLVLDHVLVDHRLRVTEHTVGPPVGSDHRSVTVKLQLLN